MRRVALAAVVASVASVGCAARPTEEECRAALDRYVEMTLGDDLDVARAGPESVVAVREAKKAARRTEPRYQAAVARCAREVSRAELECAMKAVNANAWEACIE